MLIKNFEDSVRGGRSCWLLGASLGCALFVGSADLNNVWAASERISIQLPKKAFRSGEQIQFTLQNKTGQPVSLPGCASYVVQQFGADAFVPLPQKRCDWEGNATLAAPGATSFEFTPRSERQVIQRIVITYGVGCRENVPLSRANCSAILTAYSPTFNVFGPKE